MLVENPKYETYDVIRKKYDGYCIFIINCKGETLEPLGGEVIAYNEDIGHLTREIDPFLDGDMDLGLYTTDVLKPIHDVGGPIEVITIDD
jgi:hypothetical protein